jgi:hypothetical protein
MSINPNLLSTDYKESVSSNAGGFSIYNPFDGTGKTIDIIVGGVKHKNPSKLNSSEFSPNLELPKKSNYRVEE